MSPEQDTLYCRVGMRGREGLTPKSNRISHLDPVSRSETPKNVLRMRAERPQKDPTTHNEINFTQYNTHIIYRLNDISEQSNKSVT